MKKIFLFISLVFAAMTINAQSPKVYTLFNSKGKPVTYDEMIKDLAKQDVVFFGEQHNDPIDHWMEYKVLESLYKIHGMGLAIGLEMLEADNQLIVDEYMQGRTDASHFEDECRLWPNYSTDYKPLVDFAQEHGIRTVATNIPRRYASMVKSKGLAVLDSLSDEAKRFIAPLPIPYEANPEADEGFALMMAMGKNKNANPSYMGEAQGVKDATMGWFISQNLKKHFLHFNGTYHSDANDGTVKYLKKYKPGVTVKTIYSVRQENIESLDSTYLGHGDYYLCVPEDMVTTY